MEYNKSNTKILIADENPMQRQALRESLRSAGYRNIEEALNGEDALVRINQGGTKAQLRIYTATPLTEPMKKALCKKGISFLMGSVPASEIARIQGEADMLVHAEALDLKNRLTVRQSFSTKIVDYLKAARPIIVVGPKGVASVKYFIDYNCAIVADNEKELYEKLSAVIDDKQQLYEYAARAYFCGRMNHDKRQQEAVLNRDLRKLKEM
jgi:CheY-like chemotaxis protein